MGRVLTRPRNGWSARPTRPSFTSSSTAARTTPATAGAGGTARTKTSGRWQTSSTAANGWTAACAPTAGGRGWPRSSCFPGELLPRGALHDAAPDEPRVHGVSDNEGVSVERAYHRAPLALWPDRRRWRSWRGARSPGRRLDRRRARPASRHRQRTPPATPEPADRHLAHRPLRRARAGSHAGATPAALDRKTEPGRTLSEEGDSQVLQRQRERTVGPPRGHDRTVRRPPFPDPARSGASSASADGHAGARPVPRRNATSRRARPGTVRCRLPLAPFCGRCPRRCRQGRGGVPPRGCSRRRPPQAGHQAPDRATRQTVHPRMHQDPREPPATARRVRGGHLPPEGT